MNIKEAKKYPKTLWFLIAFFFFNDGVQVTFYSAAQIGRFELGLDMGVLLQVILMVQFIAFFGTLIFKKAASRWGNKNAILFSLLIWICIIIYAYFYLKTELDFYILGAAVAVVLGGTQALSRSLYSQLIPKGKESEYYSLYELSDKGTSVLGPLIFGLTLQFTESYRFAILSLLFFFIIGFILLYKIDIKKAIKEAGN